MKIKAKLVLTLICFFLLFAFCGYVIQRTVAYSGFIYLEQKGAILDIERCNTALDWELKDVYHLAEELAFKEDSYGFVSKQDDHYLADYLTEDSLRISNIHFVAFYDLEKNLIWSRFYDLDFSILEYEAGFDPEPFFSGVDYNGQVTGKRGATLTAHGPLLVGAMPILSSSGQDQNGTLVMGRRIGPKLSEKIIEQTMVALTIMPVVSQKFTPEEALALQEITEKKPYYSIDQGDFYLNMYSTFLAVDGKPLLLLKAAVPRSVSRTGVKTIKRVRVILGSVSVVMLMVLLLFLQQIIIKPLNQLTKQALLIRKTDDLYGEMALDHRQDEIGILSREINGMLLRLRGVYSNLEHMVLERTLELTDKNDLLVNEANSHRQTKEVFEKLNDELEAIFTTSQVGIMLVKHEKMIVKVNQKLADIYGYGSPAEMQMMTMSSLYFSSKSSAEFKAKYFDKLINGRQVNFDHEFRRKNGSLVICEVSGKAMDKRVPADLDRGIIWVVEDVFARKMGQIKEQELAKMQGMFETVGAVCHELGQPVQVISAYSQLLQNQTVLDEKSQIRIKDLLVQTGRMAQILQNLQKISTYKTTKYIDGVNILDINGSIKK